MVSSSSSITKAVSNSDGSGPREPSSTTLGLGLVRFAGSARVEFDLDTVAEPAADALAFARACSSAILESMAPLSRCVECQYGGAA